jgi:multicomponent Na+:H+ antiporter subunit G
MTVLEAAGLLLMTLGSGFFVAGTVGMLRFPDAVSRLHALTKADGLGLALVALGAAVLAGSAGVALRLLLICAFAALAGAVGAHLIARLARREGGE